MRKLVLALFLLASVASADVPRQWRTYPLPSGGAILLEVPAAWKDEVRQKDPRLAATIALHPSRGKDFELLFTPIPPRGDHAPTMADVEASLRKSGERHLATARQESIVLEKLEGEQASGRYYRLSEKEPPPDEYPHVISGGLLVGPLIGGFTVLVRDLEGDDAREALRVMQSAKFLSGSIGIYRTSFETLHLNMLIAQAAGFTAKTLVDDKSAYHVQLDDFVFEADAIDRDTIRIRIDGKDLAKAREILAAITQGLPRLR
jgi:hypothetical protein